jgi:hypothetical protein
VQFRTFHQQADVDWVRFDVEAGTTYLIEARAPTDSAADVVLESYPRCEALPDESQDYTFSPNARLQFEAATDGTVFLKLLNHTPSVAGDHVSYQLSVRGTSANAGPGALIIVAGRIRENDSVQDNIYDVAEEVYALFQEHGYPTDRIYYLAPDAGRARVDALVGVDTLRQAITAWALERVGPDRPLTLYLVDHGDRDRLYLDNPRGQILTPADLDSWLAVVEAAHPGVRVNVIIEACHSGSFLAAPEAISKPGRVIITSTNADTDARADVTGAYFSNAFLATLGGGSSLYTSFAVASHSVQEAWHRLQVPWLDDNGNGIPNDDTDGQEAQQRGFTFVGTLDGEHDDAPFWPPHVAEVPLPEMTGDGAGRIRANVLAHPENRVRRVWAVIYPPSYTPPAPGDELVREELPTIVLTDQGGDWYGTQYPGFQEPGAYRVVVYAESASGLEAQPEAVTLQVGQGTTRVYLPLVRR